MLHVKPPGNRSDREPTPSQVPAHAVSEALAPDAIVCGDSGTVTTWSARQIKVRRGQSYSFSGTNCSMAAGLPYAIGAQAAFPDRQVVVFTGDGSLTMQLGDFLTAVQHQLPIKLVVIKNDTLGLIKWEQMVFLGNPEYECDLQPIDFAAFARACGGKGYTIEDPARCGEILDQALNEPGPVVIEAVVDPHEPPMPPKVTLKQAAHFAEALAKGTPHGGKIALTTLSDKVRETI